MTPGSMEFTVLGGLAIRANGRLLRPGAPKQRTLTSLLLVRANSLAPLHEITEELWGSAPPKSAIANLRTYAARLRAAFPAAERDRLVVRPLGYQLRVDTAELDLKAFEDKASSGRAALEKGRAEEALRQCETALALWRGRLLEDVPHGPVIAAREVAIDEQRRAVQEDRCEALLLLGRPAPAIWPLRSLVTELPLRERAWALLMRALYADHDVAGALDAYEQARIAITGSLGIEPGEDLRRLHQAILRRDLRPPRAVASASPPCRLPRKPVIVGREPELSFLTRRLGAAAGVVVVHGPAGAGKSSLALHAAHLIADCYPDGQLYVDLRPRRRPVSDADTALARYRSLLAEGRMLVVLDNAPEVAHVRPFLAAARLCTFLVTSCPMLTTLDGALHLRLDRLGRQEALAFLAHHVDPERLREDPGAAAEVVRLCDRLPLALRIVAARLVAHPGWSVRELLERLADDRHRLDELQTGDLSMRASMYAQVEHLMASEHPMDRLAIEVFRQAGSLPAAEISAAEAARRLHAPVRRISRALDRLVEMELLDFHARDRYRMTELPRLLARDIATVSRGALRLMPGV
ncbi:BTAD domain-containing putative transcriptional regulator [Nonomuraea sp. NPDC003709]|uniref:AfsR/SARP family transcriptional regulator n=1 Tax=Nonomuraea sp. NPDC003709 TaxID=3154450 RepID=UPI0033BDCDB9